jgi:hypothetical protein
VPHSTEFSGTGLVPANALDARSKTTATINAFFISPTTL